MSEPADIVRSADHRCTIDVESTYVDWQRLAYIFVSRNMPDHALREVLTAKQAWIEAAMASGKAIPEPRYRPVIYQLAA